MEAWARATLPADIVTSSDGVGVRKPDPAFFERLVELAGVAASEVAYVGDRVDNDVLPALTVGLVAVHCRRGPWGRLRPTPEGAIGIDSLAELPRRSPPRVEFRSLMGESRSRCSRGGSRRATQAAR